MPAITRLRHVNTRLGSDRPGDPGEGRELGGETRMVVALGAGPAFGFGSAHGGLVVLPIGNASGLESLKPRVALGPCRPKGGRERENNRGEAQGHPS